jgi:hypothetical protein
MHRYKLNHKKIEKKLIFLSVFFLYLLGAQEQLNTFVTLLYKHTPFEPHGLVTPRILRNKIRFEFVNQVKYKFTCW